ncbi:hypothetical protein GTP46_25845 [Duganella sp. FT135W]|uniref:Uncharacterized protein n=1 Tax=Duganella flavida TaxID=2692175 RepID=A0A6L8KH49_9BURK|nr:hypothetical protein [Duganella flavida]MYM26057.1 hypothetical protein [Duganella flavida]
MNLQEILSGERERYVRFLLHARDDITSKLPSTVSELLLSINNDAIPYPYRYLRVDLMSKTDDGQNKPTEVRIDLDPNFKPQMYKFGPLTLELHPFLWNQVQILLNSAPNNIKQIEDWITHWLDIEDQGGMNREGLSGAVHSFTQLQKTGDWWHMTGDFGTAPIEALVELINLMANQGITHIGIRSHG